MDGKIKSLIENIEKVIVGKKETIIQLISALLSNGHVLIEDVPGVGKTQLVAALARSLDGEYNRIQLTPDIMPSDITGFTMINKETGAFEYRRGAAFCNFLLADEINRASPKAQSALLEIMEERQISLDGQTHILPTPYMITATQNPVETYGTYHLPEAQMDRFMIKISMGYPKGEEELDILDRNESENPIKKLKSVLTLEEVEELQSGVTAVTASDAVKKYITDITSSTRENDNIKLGVSPRGSISLYKTAKAYAFIDGRSFITPDDIRNCAEISLSHRIILSPKGKSTFVTQENAINEIVSKTLVPTK